MAKFLILSTIQVFPPQSGGQQRTANLAQSLARAGHKVQVYSLTGRRGDYLSRRGDFTSQISENISESVCMNVFYGAVQLVSYRLRLPPIWATALAKLWVPRFLRQILPSVDVLICDFPFLYPWLDNAQSQAVFNSHNVEWKIWDQVPGRRWLVPLVKYIEKRAVLQSFSIFACSAEDSAALEGFVAKKSISRKFVVVPNGIDESLYARDEKKRATLRQSYGIDDDERVLLFAGSNYGPNHEGLEFLLEFSRRHAKALAELRLKFLVVGTVAKEKQLLGPVILSGYVDDFEGHFSAADYALNPIFSGSGTNVKVSQYIAANLPIITTSFGARGFNLSHNQEALFFERDDLIDAIKELHESKNLQERLLTSARANNAELIDMYPSVSKWFNQSFPQN